MTICGSSKNSDGHELSGKEEESPRWLGCCDSELGVTALHPQSLTHCFYLHMDEVLDVFLQCLMGLQRNGQVAIVLLVAEVHLDA